MNNFKALIIFLFLLNHAYSQGVSDIFKVNDFKAKLSVKVDSIDFIEGIWEVSASNYTIDNETGKEVQGRNNSNFRIAVMKFSNDRFYTRNLFLDEYIKSEPMECCDFVIEKTADKERYIITGFWCDNRKVITKEKNGDFIVKCQKGYNYFDVFTTYVFTKVFPAFIK